MACREVVAIPEGEDNDFAVPTRQKALNHAQICERNLQRLISDRNGSSQPWEECVMRAKEAYMEQKQRHAQAHETYDSDMWTAKGAQDDTGAMLRRIIMSE